MLLIPRRELWRSQPQYPVRNPDWVIFNSPAKGIELPAGSRPINVATAQAPHGVYANASVSTTSLVTGLKIANDASAPLCIAGRIYRGTGNSFIATLRGATYGWALEQTNWDSSQATFLLHGSWKGTLGALSVRIPWPQKSSVDFAVNIQWLSRATYNHFGYTARINGIRYTGEGDADHADTMNRFDVDVGCMFVGYKQALLSEDELLSLSLDATLLFPPREDLIFLPDAGVGSVTGTGALVGQDASASGAGTSSSSGTGAIVSGDAAVDGTGISSSIAVGILIDGSSTVTGTGIGLSTGTGDLVAQTSTVSGLAEDVVSGTGVLTVQDSAVAGIGTSESTGTGTIISRPAATTGAGISSSIGAGDLLANSSIVFGESLGTRAIHVQRDPAMLIKGESFTLMIVMLDASDHITGLSGLTLTIRLGKAGGALSVISRTVNDRGSGLYTVELTANDTDTEGELMVLASAAGADNSVCAVQVTDDLITDQQVFKDVLKALIVYL